MSLITACSGVWDAILDDRHRHTNIYLPYRVGELRLGKEKYFDREHKDAGYFYKNFNRTNFVAVAVFIYPSPRGMVGNDALAKELSSRYPLSKQSPQLLKQGAFVSNGKYISKTNERFFASKPDQVVRDTVYLFTFEDDWFVKIFASYQEKNSSSAQLVVDEFVENFEWIEPSHFQGYDF